MNNRNYLEIHLRLACPFVKRWWIVASSPRPMYSLLSVTSDSKSRLLPVLERSEGGLGNLVWLDQPVMRFRLESFRPDFVFYLSNFFLGLTAGLMPI